MLGRLTQLPPRELVGLCAACAFVLLLIADQVVVKPVLAVLDRMDVNISVAEKQIDHNREVLRYKESVGAQYAQVKNLIGVSAPRQESIETLKSTIDEMALENRISLKSMQHLTPQTTDFLVTYFVEISDFEAEMPSLLHFLHDVQTTAGMLRVQHLSVTSQEENATVKGSMVVSKVMTLAGEEE